MNIYITNLPPSISREALQELLNSYGPVDTIYIGQDKHSGMGNGTAYVRMQTEEAAEQLLLNLDGADYKGNKLRIVKADEADFPTNDFWN